LAVVIGVGLNCLTSKILQGAVGNQAAASLADGFVDAKALAPEVLIAPVLQSMQETLVTFSSGGFEVLREAWQAANLWQGEKVAILEADRVLLEGRIHGVDRDGALLVATPSGLERVVTGDVSLRKV
jgi:BirA family biotin operon repressor/biotin-[acetyl-CoA-carboxylase] ligase